MHTYQRNRFCQYNFFLFFPPFLAVGKEQHTDRLLISYVDIDLRRLFSVAQELSLRLLWNFLMTLSLSLSLLSRLDNIDIELVGFRSRNSLN